MSQQVQVQVQQVSTTASEGMVRGHAITMDRPAAKGGEDRGAMGGETMLMALGGCFMSNLLAAAAAREEPLAGIKFEITGTLDGAPPRFTAISLQINGPATEIEREQFSKLVTIAERGCIVANTLKAAVDLRISIG